MLEPEMLESLQLYEKTSVPQLPELGPRLCSQILNLSLTQGLTIKEARVREPEALRALENKGKDVSIGGGGESRAQLQKRASLVVEEIARKHRG